MMNVQKNVRINDHRLESLVVTQHGDITAMTAIHTKHFPWRQGGVRFVESGSEIELAHLAVGMTEKALAANIPIDGMKCLVICPSGVPNNANDRAKVLSEHIRAVNNIDQYAVFGPDMNCQEDVLDIVYEDDNLKASVTGLSKRNGGLEIDKNGFTAIGVMEAIETAKALAKDVILTASIQGFGAVGGKLADLLPKAGNSVIAISDITGCLYSDHGLNVSSFGKGALAKAAMSDPVGAYFDINPRKIFECRADILIPAARTSVLACDREVDHVALENPDVGSVETMYKAVQPKLIAEAANHPLTESAEKYLSEKGVIILPDVLINGAGMIGCWHEYKYRRQLIGQDDRYEQGVAGCLDYARDVIRKNVTLLLESKHNKNCFEREACREILTERKSEA